MKCRAHPLAAALALSLGAVLVATAGLEASGPEDVIAERKAALERGAEMGPIHSPTPRVPPADGAPRLEDELVG